MAGETLLKGKRVAISQFLDVIIIEFHCDDVYEAATLYDDLEGLLNSGKPITIITGKKVEHER